MEASAAPLLKPEPPAAPGAIPELRDRCWGLGLLRQMRRDYLGFAAERQRRCGDLCAMRLLNERTLDLFHPDHVREALVDHAAHLVRWERGIEVFTEALGRNVLTTEGATWQRQRRMLQPAFTPRRVAGHAEAMAEAAALALDAAVPAAGREATVRADALFAQVAMDVILRVLFGRPIAGEAEAAIVATRVLGETAMREMFYPMTLPDWLPLPGKAAKRQALRTLHGLIGGHIARHRAAAQVARPEGLEGGQGGAGESLLAHLLALRDEETGEGLSPAEVFDQCVVSFQAGHETSATALTWWLLHLVREPEALARAQAEVDAVLGGRRPGADDLAALPWLQASLKESMRLHPPVPGLFTRRTTAEIRIAGHAVPRGTLLYITPWVMHRDPRWFPEPEAFRPERFMPDAPPLPRAAYMPFGWGPRVCIGQHFALLEMGLVAAMLLQRCTPALLPQADAAMPRGETQVTLRPQGGTALRFVRRGLAGR